MPMMLATPTVGVVTVSVSGDVVVPPVVTVSSVVTSSMKDAVACPVQLVSTRSDNCLTPPLAAGTCHLNKYTSNLQETFKSSPVVFTFIDFVTCP